MSIGKDKRQLRAEAVERLRKNPYGNAADNQNALLGWGHEPHSLGEAKDALIDLLSEDEANEHHDLQAWLNLIVERDNYKDMLARAEQGIAELQDANDRLRADNQRLASHHPPIVEARDLERAIWQLDGKLSQAGKLAAEVVRLTEHCEHQRRELRKLNAALNTHGVIIGEDGWCDNASVRELINENDRLKERIEALTKEGA